jgi:hypothetical protein
MITPNTGEFEFHDGGLSKIMGRAQGHVAIVIGEM